MNSTGLSICHCRMQAATAGWRQTLSPQKPEAEFFSAPSGNCRWIQLRFIRLVKEKSIWLIADGSTYMPSAISNMPGWVNVSQRGGRGPGPTIFLKISITSGSRGSSLTAFWFASGRSGVGSSPVSFLYSLAKPGSLKALRIAS
jgi:hypothetical protein